MRARDYIYISLYWVALAFMWNGLHVIILPMRLLLFVPEALKNTYLGNMRFFGLILAMIIQPVAGAISDRTTLKMGRRRPYIFGGTLLDLIFLVGMALAGNYWLLFAGYFLLQFASNVAHGACQGFIPDLVSEGRRGVASGVKNLADMGGMVLGMGAAGYFMGQGMFWPALLSIIFVLVLMMAITMVTVHEEPLRKVEKKPILKTILGTFGGDLRRYPGYLWLITSRFFILLGVYAVQGFVLYFIRDVLKMANPAQATSTLVTVIGVGIVLLVYPSGYLSDRVGRKPLLIFSGLLGALGIFLLLLARSYAHLFLFGALIGASLGLFLSANWALAIDLIPREEAGRYLGISNLATAGAGAASNLLGPVIDLFNALLPGKGYTVLFILAGCFLLLGTALLVGKVKEARPCR